MSGSDDVLVTKQELVLTRCHGFSNLNGFVAQNGATANTCVSWSP